MPLAECSNNKKKHSLKTKRWRCCTRRRRARPGPALAGGGRAGPSTWAHARGPAQLRLPLAAALATAVRIKCRENPTVIFEVENSKSLPRAPRDFSTTFQIQILNNFLIYFHIWTMAWSSLWYINIKPTIVVTKKIFLKKVIKLLNDFQLSSS